VGVLTASPDGIGAIRAKTDAVVAADAIGRGGEHAHAVAASARLVQYPQGERATDPTASELGSRHDVMYRRYPVAEVEHRGRDRPAVPPTKEAVHGAFRLEPEYAPRLKLRVADLIRHPKKPGIDPIAQARFVMHRLDRQLRRRGDRAVHSGDIERHPWFHFGEGQSVTQQGSAQIRWFGGRPNMPDDWLGTPAEVVEHRFDLLIDLFRLKARSNDRVEGGTRHAGRDPGALRVIVKHGTG